jgi:hypothetical protein
VLKTTVEKSCDKPGTQPENNPITESIPINKERDHKRFKECQETQRAEEDNMLAWDFNELGQHKTQLS